MIIGLKEKIALTKNVLNLANLKCQFKNIINDYGLVEQISLCNDKCVGVDKYIDEMSEFVKNNKNKFPDEMTLIDDSLRNIKVIEGKHVCFNFYKVARIDEILKLLQYKNHKPKIFISHSEKDKFIIKKFVVMLSKFGLTNEHIFCSSVEGYNIPIGSGDIYDYLLNEFRDNELLVLMFLSKNYYASPACLNEMGAAWIRKDRYQIILMPNFDFPNIKGAINPRDITFKLDDIVLRKSRMDELKDLIFNYLYLPLPEEMEWNKQRDIFLRSIK
ncbi:MAG: toll/interleukin-1 receptor domain-containing protein [Anaeroplasma bactoclasticum]|nr:toll/interleukin-1 receptor domain-containing protein [Anaeroplasma bactoclasticum]